MNTIQSVDIRTDNAVIIYILDSMSFQRERSRSRSREHDTREDNRKNYIDISNIP
jgi:hypothetical protein